jgi:Rrf2 family protein
MILSKSADYGLRAMVYLARHRSTRLITLHEIATAMHTPPFLLGRILQRLVRARLLVSMKGHHGGFRLQREPMVITVSDIVRAIDGPFRMFDCTGIAACGLSGECTMVEMFGRAEKALEDVLHAVTLDDLACHARLDGRGRGTSTTFKPPRSLLGGGQ